MKKEDHKIYYSASDGYHEYKIITEKEYQQYYKARQYVLFYHKFQELFELVKINVFEFWTYINEVSEKHRLNFVFADYNDAMDPILFINQKILNILSSFKTFEDHLKRQLSILFGHKCTFLDNYSKLDRTAYDEYFGYRLFKRLRNYSQHYGLPIRSISYAERSQSENCKLEFYSVIPKMKRDELMQYNGWNTLKAEISKLEEDIDIRDYVNEFFHAFKIIFKGMQKQLSKNYKESKELIDQLYSECLKHSNEDIKKYNALALQVYIKNNNDDYTDVGFMLPKDTINRIDKFELKNILKPRIKDSVSFSLNTDKIPR